MTGGKVKFGCPAGIDINNDGHILIHDTSDTIHVLNPDGSARLVQSFGFNVRFATFDPADRLFIGNSFTGEVWVRDGKGASLGVWTTGAAPVDLAFGKNDAALLLLPDRVDRFAFHQCDGHLATRVGSPQADFILGTGLDDVIVALGGDDVIEAGDGIDTVCAGAGADEVYGQAGADFIFGGYGADQIFSGIGKDHVYAGPGNDEVRGIGGNDTIRGGNGADLLFGGDGDDELRGGNGDDTIRGQMGSDDMFGGPGIDVCHGGHGGLNGNTATGCETSTGIPIS